jgi:hypothetical protein
MFSDGIILLPNVVKSSLVELGAVDTTTDFPTDFPTEWSSIDPDASAILTLC